MKSTAIPPLLSWDSLLFSELPISFQPCSSLEGFLKRADLSLGASTQFSDILNH